MSKWHVVVTDDRHGSYEVERSVLRSVGADVTVTNCSTQDQVVDACADADGILCNLAPMPAGVIEKLGKCRVISRYGVGYDNVDKATCTARRMFLCNVPDYCAEEVSDQALALLLGCVRKVAHRDVQVRTGHWDTCKENPMHRISGRSFTLLGYGTIARCLHRKIKGFDPGRVLVYDPYVDEKVINDAGGEKAEWDIVLSEADFISVHLPLNDQTRGMIGREAFGLMKPSAILVNTSRGAVIDEAALIDALAGHRIDSAGLDTFETEPIEPDNPLLELSNCILSDHVGFYSEESLQELKRKAAENICDVLTGKVPKYWVNPFN